MKNDLKWLYYFSYEWYFSSRERKKWRIWGFYFDVVKVVYNFDDFFNIWYFLKVKYKFKFMIVIYVYVWDWKNF